MVIRAYVLIQIEVGQLKAFRHALDQFAHPSVRLLSADTVTGPYDAIVRLEADDLEQLGTGITEGLQALAGVRRTTTCLALPRM